MLETADKGLKNYRKALLYAHKLDFIHHKDLVHDAYLAWHKKTGNNLFEQSEGVVIQTVKNIHLSNYTRNTFMWRGEIFSKSFTEWEDFKAPTDNLNPESILIMSDLSSRLVDSLTPVELQVYNLLLQGYKTAEICEQLGLYRQIVNHKARKIKSKLNKI